MTEKLHPSILIFRRPKGAESEVQDNCGRRDGGHIFSSSETESHRRKPSLRVIGVPLITRVCENFQRRLLERNCKTGLSSGADCANSSKSFKNSLNSPGARSTSVV